jgi:hypothetical protein
LFLITKHLKIFELIVWEKAVVIRITYL